MRNVNLSAVSTTIGFPIRAGTIAHLQLATKEAVASYIRMQIGNSYNSLSAYVLYGCELVSNNISAGAVFYNGEVYLVDALPSAYPVSYPPGFHLYVNVAYSYFTDPSADPVQFTDGVNRNVHEIRKIAFGASSGVDICYFEDMIRLPNLLPLYNGAYATPTTIPVTFDKNRIFIDQQTGAPSYAFSFSFAGALPGVSQTYQINSAGSGTTYTFPSSSTVLNVMKNGSFPAAPTGPVTVLITYLGKIGGINNVAIDFYS